MPIYEFYCADCHTIYNFLSRQVETRKRPGCPRCGRRRLERKPSSFAISTGRQASDDEAGLPPGVDEARMEQAMLGLAQEAERVDENDPRAMAGLMHRFYDSTGLQMGEGMGQALERMEAGEDPDSIEEDLGNVLEKEDPFGMQAIRDPGGLRRRLGRPAVDETLYEL